MDMDLKQARSLNESILKTTNPSFKAEAEMNEAAEEAWREVNGDNAADEAWRKMNEKVSSVSVSGMETYYEDEKGKHIQSIDYPSIGDRQADIYLSKDKKFYIIDFFNFGTHEFTEKLKVKQKGGKSAIDAADTWVETGKTNALVKMEGV